MCLSTITKVITNPSQKQYAAWKVFRNQDYYGNPIELRFSHREWYLSVSVPIDKWTKAERNPIRCESSNQEYSSGFHCYLTKASAQRALTKSQMFYRPERFVILKVAVRGIAYVGTQYGDKVLVAQEMYVKKNGV